MIQKQCNWHFVYYQRPLCCSDWALVLVKTIVFSLVSKQTMKLCLCAFSQI